MSERRGFWKPVLVAAAVAIFIAVLGGSLTDTGNWYQSLRKPSWQPPDWLFGPAWTLIFALATMSAVYAWRHAHDRRQRERVIGLFALNGFLNVLWSTLFFALRRPDWASVEVAFLALCQAGQPLSASLPVLGVVCGSPESDGCPPQRAVLVTGEVAVFEMSRPPSL
jgi:tryptophan-rich sensory protein